MHGEFMNIGPCLRVVVHVERVRVLGLAGPAEQVKNFFVVDFEIAHMNTELGVGVLGCCHARKNAFADAWDQAFVVLPSTQPTL